MIVPRLFHYSEEPDIREFVPRPHKVRLDEEARVWAISETFAPLYYFPRNCPRAAWWALPDTTPNDLDRFLCGTSARIVLAIESAWLARMQTAELYEYQMPPEAFVPVDPPGSPTDHGAYGARETITPLAVRAVGDLLARLTARSDVELRVTPSLWPLYDGLLASTLHYSFIRWAHTSPRLLSNAGDKKELL